MANVPGTSGPVNYPNQPEGGVEGGPGYNPLPGGTNRVPEPYPATVSSQQGAGVPGNGGLTPNPGTPSDGTLQTGWKGSDYSGTTDVAGDVAGGLSTPSGFTGL